MNFGKPSVGQQHNRTEREREFWDRHALNSANGLGPEEYRTGANDRYDRSVPWLPYIGMPNYIEQVLEALGDVTGKSVLDLGTGSGFLAALLAARGARVDAVDVSEESLELARMRAAVSGVSDRMAVHNMPADALDFPDENFDAVVGTFLLHHLDLTPCLTEIHRVMRPGAKAVFIETWGRNKILMAARATLTGRFGIEKAGSDDERPLGRAACRIIAASAFTHTEYSFPDLLFFRMAGYMPWARLGLLPHLWSALDTVIGLIPGARSFSYFTIVTLRK